VPSSTTRRLAVLAVVSALLATCASGSGDAELEPVTFMAGFAPQANLPFVGVYVAAANGYFAEEGLDVTIEHSAGGGEHLQLLASGAVDVTTQDAAVVLQRRADPGIPLVALALLGQRGQQAFVAMADSGMATPADWVGHRVGFKGTPPPDLFAILDASGVSADDVELVNVGFDVRVFTEGQVDVYPVFKSNEPDIITGLGFDIVTWDAADFGVPTLGLTYVATEESVEERPGMLRRFLAAALRGIAWAEANPDEAVDIVLTHTGEEADPDHQRFMLDSELADYRSEVTEANGDAWQTVDQWQALHDLLVEHEALAQPVDVTEAFTTELLPGR
jgi:ABC-type nitrate/sulfonate/bicarbonate transport system substrate-binding protein